MSVLALEGLVEKGRIKLVGGAVLPDNTKVYVVVPEATPRVPRIWSPRLAESTKAADFRMQVSEPSKSDPDAHL